MELTVHWRLFQGQRDQTNLMDLLRNGRVHWRLFQGQRGQTNLMDLLRNGAYGTLASIPKAARPTDHFSLMLCSSGKMNFTEGKMNFTEAVGVDPFSHIVERAAVRK